MPLLLSLFTFTLILIGNCAIVSHINLQKNICKCNVCSVLCSILLNFALNEQRDQDQDSKLSPGCLEV